MLSPSPIRTSSPPQCGRSSPPKGVLSPRRETGIILGRIDEQTSRHRAFTREASDAILRCPFISKGCEEVLAVPAKAKKGTKKKATPKKK
jgi:hypothetical protein